MTKQDMIIEKLDKIIELLTKENTGKLKEPLITFSKANTKADDSFIIERQKEIFQLMDNKD